MRSFYSQFIILMTIACAMGCNSTSQESNQQYKSKKTFDSEKLYAVVEVPAGSSYSTYYNFVKQELEAVTDTMEYLPFPGNYGFILRPDAMEKSLRRTDHLSCLILSSAITEKEVVEVYSIGVLTLEKDGIEEHIIISIPVEKEQQTMPIEDFVDFMTKYEAVRYQIQHWFLNHKGPNKVHIKGWEDEEFAGRLIDEQESN